MSRGTLKDKLEGNEIDLGLCNLTAVPVEELADIPAATSLDLSCNLLVSIPDSFCTLVHLVKVDLSKNKLTELPEEFGRLVHLQHLDLLGNELVALPPTFCRLHSLRWLDLRCNPLNPALRERAGDCLNEEECRACAHNVLMYMTETYPEFAVVQQNRTSSSSHHYWLFRLPAIIITMLTVGFFFMACSSTSIKKKLCGDDPHPVCAQGHGIIVRMVRHAEQLWRSVFDVSFDFPKKV